VLWEVPGAVHTGAWNAEPQVFEHKVLDWFQVHQQANADFAGS